MSEALRKKIADAIERSVVLHPRFYESHDPDYIAGVVLSAAPELRAAPELPEALKKGMIESIEFLDGTADLLDKWAETSETGGWSTHQVKPNRDLANGVRRQASRLRAIIAKAGG